MLPRQRFGDNTSTAEMPKCANRQLHDPFHDCNELSWDAWVAVSEAQNNFMYSPISCIFLVYKLAAWVLTLASWPLISFIHFGMEYKLFTTRAKFKEKKQYFNLQILIKDENNILTEIIWCQIWSGCSYYSNKILFVVDDRKPDHCS